MAEIRHLIPIETRVVQPAHYTAPLPGAMRVEGRHAMAPVLLAFASPWLRPLFCSSAR
jgi:hypothetical protein